ncbi:hypothetical protein LTS02_014195 [Friedmanniomyces endolithicus]|nr:hypothetical protein LTR94_020412 [Friedmanniomyces endolithicus]KAK0771473.1 hypothetical protein LTR59_016076 [Friedmanniomyces endolithicus]KAK0788942.1 hypothetical protein LTR38_011090 [Friedmanniomyces endolithicus]KAK0795315.1 hypothetical protein LTR75_010555 [Friedmanniomyces endolithicus]KAK0839016.1 hypothetical protein LTR03_011587 [Friedmanniomyces endolithicus]
MPPRPFPYALNIGTDIVHVPRIRALIAQGEGEARKDNLHRFLRRLLTAREQELFWKKQKGISLMLGAHLEDTAKWLAGRWAAKEAVIKAVRYRRLTFWDVQILGSRSSPYSSPVYALILDRPGSGHTPHGRGVRQYDVTAILQSDVNDVLQQYGAANLQRDGSAVESLDHDPDPDGQVAKVNISHDGDYATAVCLAADLPRDGDVGGEAAAREP